jgi:hypothetical protein
VFPVCDGCAEPCWAESIDNNFHVFACSRIPTFIRGFRDSWGRLAKLGWWSACHAGRTGRVAGSAIDVLASLTMPIGRRAALLVRDRFEVLADVDSDGSWLEWLR